MRKPRGDEGNLVVRLPKELHREARIKATEQEQTLRVFVMQAIEEKLARDPA
jgi:predicted HicB family RNase H-like nuclease